MTRGLALDDAGRVAMRTQLVELTLIPYVGSAQAAAAVARDDARPAR